MVELGPYGVLVLGVKLAQFTCTSWLTRLVVWFTVTQLALGSGPPFPPFAVGSHRFGPVTVVPEPVHPVAAAGLAKAPPGCARPGSISSPPMSDTRPARASTRRGRKAGSDALRMNAPEKILQYGRPWLA